MRRISLKSSVNWCTHELISLKPINNHPDELWFKAVSNYPIKIINDQKAKLPMTLSFHCGPALTIGAEGPDPGTKLKEICYCYNKQGDFIYYALIYDISSNEETGII